MSKNKYLITQSLLSAYRYIFEVEDGYEDFLKTLNREPIQPNMAMLNGQQFENLVSTYIEGIPMVSAHKWANGVQAVGDQLKGCAWQVKLSKTISLNGVEFVLYGILDALKAGVVYDVKFSQTYVLNKYLDSPQHPMYFALCPEAHEFKYLVSEGDYLYTETYRPDDCVKIEQLIIEFMRFLEIHNLIDIYFDKWQSQY